MKKKIAFQSWSLWKYKFELLLLILVIVSVISVFAISAGLFAPEEQTTVELSEELKPDAYEVTIDGQFVGVVDSALTGEEAFFSASMNIKNILGYDPNLTPEIRFNETTSEGKTLLSQEALTEAIEEQLIDGIDVIREEAYVMKIGDDFKVAVASIEEAEAVLQAAQDVFVAGDSTFAVSLETKNYNSLVMTPVVHEILTDTETDRTFVTSSDEKFLVPGVDYEPLAAEDIFVEEDAVIDPKYNGDTTGVAFSEPVVVAPSYVDPSDILSVNEATALITKENEEPKLYEVQSGDCPSIIAENHEMSLSSLYEMNEGLEDNASRLQIGQELIVMVPEPELSVSTYEEVVYVESIPRGSTYYENPDKYVGHTATTYSGYDGELQVTAVLTKVNGKEVERTITDQLVLLEPENRVIEKGTKPLPSKGATGSYIPPVVSYTITSKFGYRWGGFHYGVDMAASTGTTIRASDGGVVTYAGWMGDYGYLVIIDHGQGVTTRYGHCSSLNVSVGQYVSQYEKIAEVGNTGRSTGPHLHFEIRFDGIAADPLTYLEYQ